MSTIAAGKVRAAAELARRLASVAAVAMAGSLLMAAGAVVCRRLAGHLEASGHGVALVAAMLTAALLASEARRLAEFAGGNGRTAPNAGAVHGFTYWASLVALLTLAAGLSLPEAPPLAIGLVWLIAVADQALESWWYWRPTRGARGRASVEPRPRRLAETGDSANGGSDTGVDRQSSLLEDREEPLSEISRSTHSEPFSLRPDVTQQLVRTESPTGERLEGLLQTALAAGQRNATLHVAFCPPFAAAPKISIYQMAGPASRVKVAQALPFGMRLELKRTATAGDAGTVAVRFVAESPTVSS